MQKINWRPWSKDIFSAAKKAKKPILLDISASWCHWCQVMEKTTYNNDVIAKLINENFIPVKVDTDKRPDINSRYNLGGWPTTAFLKPDGSLITGGTYIEPRDMQLLLNQVYDYLQKVEHGEKPPVFPEADWTLRPPEPVASKTGITKEVVDYFSAVITDNYDRLYGGFGYQPKFPLAKALELTLVLAFTRGDNFLNMLISSLEKMAAGEIFDQVNGGFFRYATQRDWSKPHYEKLLIDQAELLNLYLNAFLLTDSNFFATIAGRIFAYCENFLWLGNSFAGSQAADEKFYALAAAEQKKAKAPSVDKTVYTAANCRMITAYLKIASALGLTEARSKALTALDFLSTRAVKEGLWAHYLENGQAQLFGYLEDQAAASNCLLDAFEATAASRYLSLALELSHAVRANNYDEEKKCFLDRKPVPEGQLNLKLYPIAANADLAIGLHRLAKVVGSRELAEIAKNCLNAFSESYRYYALFAANYAYAVNWLLEPNLEIFITGDRALTETQKIWLELQRTYHPFKVLKLAADYVSLPIALEASLTENPGAFICLGEDCLPPANNLKTTRERLAEVKLLSQSQKKPVYQKLPQ